MILRDKILTKLKKRNVRVFTIPDIIELASHDGVRKELVRMTKDNLIFRLMSGVYCVSQNSNEYPTVEEVVDALTRNYNWKIWPAEEYALYLLGLTLEAPKVYTYICSGPHRQYEFNGNIIKFKHAVVSKTKPFSYHTNLIIQGLYELGKENITEEALCIVATKFSKEELEVVLEESKSSALWIQECISKIYQIKA
ncbi:MAG: hypothetical protein K2N65_00725 [Anaeroplasmataceae bacterium]|nr:hypothetical protein [Anaeroplasmataceae bacterium]